MKALLLVYLINFLSPGLFNVPAAVDTLRWFVLLCAALRVFLDFFIHELRFGLIRRWLLWLIVFCVVAASLSALASPYPTVSFLKLLAFLVGFATVLQGLRFSKNYDWLNWIFTVWCIVLLIGFPLLFNNLGYVRNGLGFQGILNHPQMYGFFFAVPAVYISVKFLLREVARDPITILFLIAVWTTVIASQARTGIFAGTLAILCSLIWFFIRGVRDNRQVIRLRFKPASLILGGLALTSVLFYWSTISQGAIEFIAKSSLSGVSEIGTAGGIDSLLRERSNLIVASWNNFTDHPLTGIGFGVPSEPYFASATSTQVSGLPVSVPVEKVFLPTAILEETGVIGSACFFTFLMVLCAPILRYGWFSTVVLFLTAVFVNFGEMVILSAGGGVYIWLCIGLATILAPRDYRSTESGARADPEKFP